LLVQKPVFEVGGHSLRITVEVRKGHGCIADVRACIGHDATKWLGAAEDEKHLPDPVIDLVLHPGHVGGAGWVGGNPGVENPNVFRFT
jgi:hypothetical protein